LNYIDTTEIQNKTIAYIVDAAAAKAKNDYHTAVINYMLALRYDSTPAILYSIAECFLMLERYDLAIEYSHSALKLEPAFLPVYEILCKAYIGELDLRNAILTLENALLMDENETMLYYLAYLYEFQNANKARQIYKKLIEKFNNEDALKHLINLNRLADAEETDETESIEIRTCFFARI
jgi:tetratricopeptide (TPR) repeat protein